MGPYAQDLLAVYASSSKQSEQLQNEDADGDGSWCGRSTCSEAGTMLHGLHEITSSVLMPTLRDRNLISPLLHVRNVKYIKVKNLLKVT